MADRKPATNEQDPRVQAALREYMERQDQGRAPDPEQFLAEHADIADELRSFLAADEQLAGLQRAPQREVSTHSVAERGMETIIPQRVQAAERQSNKSALPPEFGRYRIEKPLGSGAMGTVYLAEDSQLHRKVAIKTPSFDEDETGELLERFYREARSAATLRHSNICPVYDVGEINGRHYISMAYIKGRPLSAYIQPGKPQSERNILVIVRKIALALQEAHEHGIIHRDLKPGNIMVDEKGEPIIMDFGLARKVQKDGESRLTQSGMIVGSPAYMSPEQIEADSDKLTAAADQYSLGCILYELLTGRLPFRGGITAVIGAILTKDPLPVAELRPDVSPRVAALCARMMHKQAADRFPSCKAVADEIAAILRDDKSVLATPPTNPSFSRDPKGSAPQSPASTPKPRPKSKPTAPAVAAVGAAAAASVTQSNVASLYEAAQKCMRKYDYEQVVQMLDTIPEHKRTSDVAALLKKARELADEVAFLLAEIDEAQRLNDNESLARKADELLKLKPKHHKALQLKEELRRYGKGRVWKPGGYTPDGRRVGEGSWIPWIGIAVGIAAFGLTLWAVTIYLRAGEAVVRIQINDPDVEVSFQGRTLNIQSANQDLKVDPGEDTLTIRYGDAVFETDKFTLNKGENPAVVIDLLDKSIAAKFGEESLGEWPVEPADEESAAQIAQPDADVASNVPPDAVAFQAHAYKFFPEKLSWHDARDRCQNLKGHLVIIDSVEENVFVAGLVQAGGKGDAWIGATDEAEEGAWFTVTGRPLAYTNWGPSQPNNKGAGEHFALITNHSTVAGEPLNWQWSDQPDNSTQHEPGYVCEWDVAADQPANAAQPAATGWIDLFANGIGAWQGQKDLWSYENGVLTGKTKTGQGNTFLFSPREYTDFELRFQYRIGDGVNTGVQVRSVVADRARWSARGPQCDIGRRGADQTGGLWGEPNDGWLLQPARPAVDRLNEWNDYFVHCDGRRVRIDVNGVTIVDGQVPSMAASGLIAFQIHGGNTANVEFRNVQIRDLTEPASEPAVDGAGWTELFNGRDLTGWNQVGDGGWTVQNGVLTGAPGNGWIATAGDFANFELELEFKLPAGANSGVFLRIPDQGELSGGDFMEVQLIDPALQPNIQDWQRTGAIYAVQGPTLVPNIALGQWHQLTIKADGPEITVAIDGVQVNRVNLDTAPVVGPPKRDLKRPSGHIGFQHRNQPVEFRNIRIRELDPAAASAASETADWQDLFSGHDLTGWQGDSRRWEIRNEVLAATTASGPVEYLMTDEEYADFELRLEFRLLNQGNSGVQFRSTLSADGKAVGHQAEIGYPQSSGAVGASITGDIYGQGMNKNVSRAEGSQRAAIDRALRSNDWNEMVIRCNGPHEMIEVNGIVAADITDDAAPRSGRIGLQLFNRPEIEFRSIRVRELDPPADVNAADWTDLFNGRNLAGWQVKGPQSGWTVQDGALTATDGSLGNTWIETDTEYSDFELQLECKLVSGGDTGVFLRIPDVERPHGGDFLEIQLADDAAAAGLEHWQLNGSVYSLQGPNPPAPLEIGQWQLITIRAVGPEITVSINGREVNRVNIDTAAILGPVKRDLHSSRGRIGLQRHGPPVQFRNIRVRELAAAAASAVPVAVGWTDLFNGQDLTGWQPMETVGSGENETHRASSGGWRVANGELLCATNKAGWLKSASQYTDFELELEFKLAEGDNSDLLIRCPATGHLSKTGMAIQIIDEHSGKFEMRPDNRPGAIWGAVGHDILPSTGPLGTWNRLRVRCEGARVQVSLNDQATVDANLTAVDSLRERPPSGFIGLSNWGGEANGVAFRNIRIRAISAP